MNLRFHPRNRTAGITLIECIVYIAVFALLLGMATTAFYICWDNTRAVMSTADKIEAALRAGERWRADVRNATGPIAVEADGHGETMHIPEAEKEIVYRFAAGELRREISSQNAPQLMLAQVGTSEMKTEIRNGVTTWVWEVKLAPTRKILPHPLWFMFEAVPAKS